MVIATTQVILKFVQNVEVILHRLGLVFLLLLHSRVSHAVLLIGQVGPGSPFRPLDGSQPEFSEAYTILSQNQWSNVRRILIESPEKIEQFKPLLSGQPGAEEKFINEKINETIHGTAGVQVRWIPTTIWDLFAIHQYLTDERFRKEFWDLTTWSGSKLAKGKSSGDLYAFLAPRLIKVLQNPKYMKILEDPNDTSAYSDLLLDLLRGIQGSAQSYNPAYMDPFKADYNKMVKKQPNLLNQAVHLEIEAHQQNQDLLWRATNGVALYKANTTDPRDVGTQNKEFSEYEKMLTLADKWNRNGFENLDLKEQECFNQWVEEKKIFKNHERREGFSSHGALSLKDPEDKSQPMEVLDFPYMTDSTKPINYNLNVVDYLKESHGYGKRLSFAYSLLAGYIYDGPTHPRNISACTYEVSQARESKFTYGVFLDKTWEVRDGKNLFYFPTTPEDYGIWAEGERFHPSSRAMPGIRKPYDHQIKWIWDANAKNFSPPNDEKNREIREAIIRKLQLTLHDKANVQEASLEELGKLADSLLEHANFATQLSDVIANHGRILNINGRIVSNSDDDPGAQVILNRQKEAAGLWESFLKQQATRNKITTGD